MSDTELKAEVEGLKQRLADSELLRKRTLEEWEEAEEDVRRLKKALSFYANPKKHELKGHWCEGYPGGIMYRNDDEMMVDNGQIATEALKGGV